MTPIVRSLALALVLSACSQTAARAPVALPPAPPDGLRPPAAFAAIADRTERSRALFVEASRVLVHPRCTNCHPAGDTPTQGDAGYAHDPPVARGADGSGVPALECRSCHQDRNLDGARVPGAPEWRLAPAAMAWRGLAAPDLCVRLKDRARNGGRTSAQLIDHATHDPLVGWGWHPGAGRAPAPGTQDGFGALIAAWIETGAACPLAEASR